MIGSDQGVHGTQSLPTWVHSGFSVHVGPPILPGDHVSLEHLGRYITRAPLKIDAVRETAQTVIVPTPGIPAPANARSRSIPSS